MSWSPTWSNQRSSVIKNENIAIWQHRRLQDEHRFNTVNYDLRGRPIRIGWDRWGHHRIGRPNTVTKQMSIPTDQISPPDQHPRRGGGRGEDLLESGENENWRARRFLCVAVAGGDWRTMRVISLKGAESPAPICPSVFFFLFTEAKRRAFCVKKISWTFIEWFF